MIDIAYAMAPPSGQGDTSTYLQFLPMILIFAIFYFLLIRPQQKKAKDHANLLKNLKKGDSVITQGGLYGKITALGDRVVGLEIAKNVIVQVSRGHIAGIAAPTEEQNP